MSTYTEPGDWFNLDPVCKQATRNNLSRHIKGPKRDLKRILWAACWARDKFLDQLAVDYGPENVPLLFHENTTTTANGTTARRSVTRSVFQASPLSWDRLTRKVARKILQALLSQTPQPCTWISAGHSVTAGHGNFVHESFTAILEQGARPLFQAVGLDFRAKNFGMGGASSGMDIASCTKEIFGTDVDALLWNYGMTTTVREGQIDETDVKLVSRDLCLPADSWTLTV